MLGVSGAGKPQESLTGVLGTGCCQPIRGTHRLLDAHFLDGLTAPSSRASRTRRGELPGALPPPLCSMAQFPVAWGKQKFHLKIHSATSQRYLMPHLLPRCQLAFLLWGWPAPGQSCVFSPVLASTSLMAAHPGHPPLTLGDAKVVNPLCG